jgi:hypothetical protein
MPIFRPLPPTSAPIPLPSFLALSLQS